MSIKFRFASDLHLEFFHDSLVSKYGTELLCEKKDAEFTEYAKKLIPPLESDTNTVLLLAGDICENWRAHTRYRGFFDHVSAQFALVVWIPGNHEYYGHKLSVVHDKRVTDNMVEAYSNVIYGNRCSTDLSAFGADVHLLGATLWTNMNGGHPLTTFDAGLKMNDYRKITHADTQRDIYRNLRVEDTIAEYHLTKDWMHEEQAKIYARRPNAKIVVMTHHAPSFMSIHQRYLERNDPLNGAYASEFPIELSFSKAPFAWIHGHLHDTVNYTLGETAVISNPYGYVGHHLNDQYDPIAAFEVKDETV